ncbi:CsgG/HfaB family protein [Megamonas hypermegale]|uniref:CsgG/HfaB family protein n=1 Tax=Megamonas hypermegale TaxID=158847 RepID=UPI0026E9BDBC|nr:CsgG/HfaB family protein [Megamonas hypermegale]
MKKILLVLMSLCMLSSVCFASMADKVNAISSYTGETKKVSILLDAPLGYVASEEITDMVQTKADEMFPTPKFLITPFEESQMMKQIYREDHGIPTTEWASTYGQALKTSDIQEIGKSLNTDYVLFIQVSDSGIQTSHSSSFIPIPIFGNISSSKATTNVTCNIRVMDVKTGKYVVMKSTSRSGESSSTMVGGVGSSTPSFEKVYLEAIEKCLFELDIDTSKL